MHLNLLVIKTPDIHALADFYSLLGLEFEYHKHEEGVFHYSANIGGTIFEIYPLPKNEIADKNLRLGFKIENLPEKIKFLESKNCKIAFYSGKMVHSNVAIIEDLDGRKIELTES